ncbi:hypothetical protein BJ742DRAFT_892711 [Cladochytrium replicatum]|nr:hypothetical protein BJ742DRAFT_892711 [Cladochytrium replicatum]
MQLVSSAPYSTNTNVCIGLLPSLSACGTLPSKACCAALNDITTAGCFYNPVLDNLLGKSYAPLYATSFSRSARSRILLKSGSSLARHSPRNIQWWHMGEIRCATRRRSGCFNYASFSSQSKPFLSSTFVNSVPFGVGLFDSFDPSLEYLSLFAGAVTKDMWWLPQVNASETSSTIKMSADGASLTFGALGNSSYFSGLISYGLAWSEFSTGFKGCDTTISQLNVLDTQTLTQNPLSTKYPMVPGGLLKTLSLYLDFADYGALNISSSTHSTARGKVSSVRQRKRLCQLHDLVTSNQSDVWDSGSISGNSTLCTFKHQWMAAIKMPKCTARILGTAAKRARKTIVGLMVMRQNQTFYFFSIVNLLWGFQQQKLRFVTCVKLSSAEMLNLRVDLYFFYFFLFFILVFLICRKETYCNKECQISAWPSHKPNCNPPQNVTLTPPAKQSSPTPTFASLGIGSRQEADGRIRMNDTVDAQSRAQLKRNNKEAAPIHQAAKRNTNKKLSKSSELLIILQPFHTEYKSALKNAPRRPDLGDIPLDPDVSDGDSYSDTFSRAFGNLANTADILTRSRSHVFIGFADLGFLINSKIVSDEDFDDGEVEIVGYDASAYVVAKATDMLRMLQMSAPVDRAWKRGKNNLQLDEEIHRNLTYWNIATPPTLVQAHALWFSHLGLNNSDSDVITGLDRKADRVEFMCYLLTGDISDPFGSAASGHDLASDRSSTP